MRKALLKLKSDESLMQGYGEGDVLAFEILYERHKSGLFHYLYCSCQDESLVEDLAHEVWLAVIRRAEQYSASARFKTYLYRIAWHKLVDHWRSASRHQRVEGGFEESEYLDLDTISTGHEQWLDVREMMAAIDELPGEQRTAFLLKEEGFSQQEIADITDAKPETVKSRIRYANKALRELLEAKA